MGGRSFEGPSQGYIDEDIAVELLQTGQYERLTKLLQDAQVANEQTTDTILAEILVAAHRICLVLVACQAEVGWHQRAVEEARQRENQLKEQLHAMFDLVGNRGASDRGEMEAMPPTSTPKPDLPESREDKSEVRAGLWHRVQSLLGLRPNPRSIEPEIPVETARGLAQSPSKYIRESTPPSIKQEEVPSAGLTQEVEAPGESSAEKSETPPQRSIEQVEAPVVPSAEKVSDSTPHSTDETEAHATSPADVSVNVLATSLEADQKQEERNSASLIVYCLGLFRVYQDDQPIKDWLSSRGKSIFKYLVTHREYPIAKEVLMELFWPEATPDAARNNLNVAIYGLRQTLRKARPNFSHILFQDDCYLLNPELQIWIDFEGFIKHFKTAKKLEQRSESALAVSEYRAAEALYQGEFLEEDRYEDWLLPQRRALRRDYLSLLDCLSRHYIEQENYDACATMCSKMLAVDRCREEAHRRLMRCYHRQGQRYLALRQYHLCVEALAQELNVGPSQLTRELHERIRRR